MLTSIRDNANLSALCADTEVERESRQQREQQQDGSPAGFSTATELALQSATRQAVSLLLGS